MTGKTFSPFLLLLAKLTESELLHTIQFLKAENETLRSRLPRAVKTTPAERSRLLKLAEPLAGAVKEIVSIVTFRTFQRWQADAKKTARKPEKCKRGRRRKPEEIRRLVVRMARENSCGYTRIPGELRKLRISVHPHSGLDKAVVGDEKPDPESAEQVNGIVCETWLGGLLRHYQRAA